VIRKPIKKDASNYDINLKKIIQKSSHNFLTITIFQMLLAGRRTHTNKAFFMGSRGFFMGSDYGKSKCYGLIWIMLGVTLVMILQYSVIAQVVKISKFTASEGRV
jgi:hypothetical protein